MQNYSTHQEGITLFSLKLLSFILFPNANYLRIALRNAFDSEAKRPSVTARLKASDI